jgi:hypothetical protein
LHLRHSLVLALCGLAFAGHITTIPLTTNITDFDASGGAYDIQSDGSGAYLNNVDAVTTFLTSNGYNHMQYGDWQFDATGSTVRTVKISLDTDDAVQPGDPHYTAPANPPFWGSKLIFAHIEDKCTLVGKNMLTMTAGTAFTCPLIIRFPASSRSDYRIYIAPSFTGYTETTDVQVSCNAQDSGGCNDWFIDPIPVVNPDGTTSPGKSVGRLELDTSRTITNDGDFYMTFHIHLTRP